MTDIDLSLLPDYLIEASEHLEEMESLLLKLAEEPESTELMNEIFRPIHSIKGAAQFIGLERSSHLAHRLEDLLDLLRKGEHPSGTEVVELLISARDLIVSLAEELENTQAETSSVDEMVALITAEIEGGTGQKSTATPETTVAVVDEPAQTKTASTEYEEENDQELFGIFLENMREKIDLVRTQSAEFENSADKVALLERCAENIQALQSAANYMGYEELTVIYNNWHEDIVAVQQTLADNEDVPYDFMDGYLVEILVLFPQLGPQHTPQPKQQKIAIDNELTASVVDDELKPAEAPASAVYKEENDQELFDIFFENMREKIDLVRIQATELENSADKVALLERCAENIQALQSAANYMGYEELTVIYNNWHEDIVAVQQALADNDDVPYDFMDGYLVEILAIFPQLGLQPEAQPDMQQTDEEILYQKLSKTLDTDVSKSEGAEYELLHGVFEEMISERGDISSEEQPAVKVVSTESTRAKAQPANAKQKVTKKEDTVITAKSEKEDQQVKAKTNKPATTGKTGDAALKKNIRVEAEKIDSLINQVGELVVDRAYFFQLFDDMRGLQQHFKDDIGLDQKEMKQVRAFTYRMGEAIASLSRTSNELQEGVMKIRMLPISQLFNRYPRLVHDLTRKNSKKVNLRVEGEDTELDKMVVEKLSDPLIHIIRNAIDHGLEDAKNRISAGKPETGTLFLKSYHESNQVVVEIMDDGCGIDPELVKNKAIEKGVVSKNEADRMTPQEIIRLITAAGFSTADKISDTSGRGVGMDVVRKNIEKLNGTLEIDSRVGQGTSIRLKIPLTLAIIPAHLVRVSGNMYTIPLANIEETLRIKKDETTVIEGTEVIYLREKTLPIIHLSTLFNTHALDEDSENFFVVVVNTGTQKIGLVVDELLGQEEVVIKPLEDYLRDQTGFSGATIIGDGSISLILDIYEIANMMANEQIRRQQERMRQRQSAGAAG